VGGALGFVRFLTGAVRIRALEVGLWAAVGWGGGAGRLALVSVGDDEGDDACNDQGHGGHGGRDEDPAKANRHFMFQVRGVRAAHRLIAVSITAWRAAALRAQECG
jgi:hypothetical protein